MRVAVLYEHPVWSTELLARVAARGVDVTAIDIGELCADPAMLPGEHELWINRVNAMPSAGRPPSVVAATTHLLLALELQGRRVVNGLRTFTIGGSKAAQATMFTRLGMATPASIAIHRPADALDAADRIGFPLVTKPNVGGSGSGIVRYDRRRELEAAVEAGRLDLGIDGTGLVQRVIESADGLIHRVEMLSAELFYATEQPIQPGAFNYCAADGCGVGDRSATIELFEPPAGIVALARRVMALAGAEVAGVEYLIDRQTGAPCFYDFNPYSNFITGYNDRLGFDPIDRYLDHVLAKSVSA